MNIKTEIRVVIVLLLLICCAGSAIAGPYTEAGVNGYIGDDWQHADPRPLPDGDDDARINPIFRGWATDYKDYLPSDSDSEWSGDWNNPSKALGAVTGDNFDIVSLGDLNATEIADANEPGQITLIFGNPNNPNDLDCVRDVNGYDFVVFENGFQATGSSQIFAELGYVEVSSNGEDFARFPSVSLTKNPVGAYSKIDSSDLYNLAGKHSNAYGNCVGTPFDLSDLIFATNVVNGDVDLEKIHYIRIVDIPGTGDFSDNAAENIDPNSIVSWENYSGNHPVYDPWHTWGSGGVDLEAIGVLNEQEYLGDINLDGIVNDKDLLLFAGAWLSQFGDENWIAKCDIAKPKNLSVDFLDFAILISQWGEVEQWRN